jgi:hypothetical protein
MSLKLVGEGLSISVVRQLFQCSAAVRQGCGSEVKLVSITLFRTSYPCPDGRASRPSPSRGRLHM